MGKYVDGLVSVIIPTYKRSDMLLRAIQSVLNQTYKNLELIVVNDNERGDEYSQKLYLLIEKIEDSRLVFVEQEKHINGAAARNAGIKVAKGEYIAFQDDDDYWNIDKIEKQVNVLSSLDQSWGAVSCLKKLFVNGKLIEASVPYKSGQILDEIMDGRISLGTGAVLIRRSALDDAGYFDESLIRHQDIQLFTRLASKYKIKLDKRYMHNRETKDTQNRPNTSNIDKIKKAYFHSVSDIIAELSLKRKRQLRAIHKFETVSVFWRNNQKKEAVKRALAIFQSPSTFIIVLTKIKDRIKGKVFRKNLVKKYGD